MSETNWRQDLIAVTAQRGAALGAVHVAVAVTVPLAVLLTLGRPEWVPYAVFGSVASAVGKTLERGPRLAAQAIVGAALVLAVVLGVAASASGSGSLWALPAMGAVSLLGAGITWRTGFMPVPSLFLVFATGTLSAIPHQWADVGVALAVSTGAALFATIVSQLLIPLQRRGVPNWNTRPTRDAIFGGVRLTQVLSLAAAAPMVAGAAGLAIDIPHSFWASVSATVLLHGATLRARMVRGVHRVIGTILGCALAVGILAVRPSIGAIVAMIGVLQLLTELFVARNYGIAVVFITPLALLLTELGVPQPILPLAALRIVESALGVLVAVMIVWVVGRSADRTAGASTAQ